MKTIKQLLLTAAVVAGIQTAAFGQATTNSTTLASAVSATANTIEVSSATGIEEGDFAFVDREAMIVNDISSTTLTVSRGYGSTISAHSSGETIYVDDADAFRAVPIGGGCTSTEYRFLPVIDIATGDVADCLQSLWVNLKDTVEAVYESGPLATGSVDSIFFTANREYTVVDIQAVWATAESGGTVTLMPERLQATEACGSGDDLLASTMDGTATANTVLDPGLTTTRASLVISEGNRICIDYGVDTPGELLNVVVTVTMWPTG